MIDGGGKNKRPSREGKPGVSRALCPSWGSIMLVWVLHNFIWETGTLFRPHGHSFPSTSWLRNVVTNQTSPPRKMLHFIDWSHRSGGPTPIQPSHPQSRLLFYITQGIFRENSRIRGGNLKFFSDLWLFICLDAANLVKDGKSKKRLYHCKRLHLCHIITTSCRTDSHRLHWIFNSFQLGLPDPVIKPNQHRFRPNERSHVSYFMWSLSNFLLFSHHFVSHGCVFICVTKPPLLILTVTNWSVKIFLTVKPQSKKKKKDR